MTPGFEEIERDFGPMVRRIAASHEADRQQAEELVQDIWLALWRALPGFRGESALRTFVARVATYRAISHVRRGARSPRTSEMPDDLPAAEPSPEQQAIGRDQQANLLAAVRALPEALRPVALLTLEGLTPQEIAAVLGITANAVAIRLSRARNALRNRMGEPP
jgi:RNA polymerase sigma-70 factor (ECF subfamily)